MKVVVIGPRDHQEYIYRQIVHDIIDQCLNDYPKVLIVTKSCDQGVGKLIRTRCLFMYDPVLNKKPEFDMVEINLRHHLVMELPQPEFQANFDSLNAALLELGDEFHLILGDDAEGGMHDILKRVRSTGRPYATYRPSELKTGAKKPSVDQTTTAR